MSILTSSHRHAWTSQGSMPIMAPPPLTDIKNKFLDSTSSLDRLPSPQPAHLNVPGTHTPRVLHDKGSGYIAQKFEGKDKQMEAYDKHFLQCRPVLTDTVSWTRSKSLALCIPISSRARLAGFTTSLESTTCTFRQNPLLRRYIRHGITPRLTFQGLPTTSCRFMLPRSPRLRETMATSRSVSTRKRRITPYTLTPASRASPFQTVRDTNSASTKSTSTMPRAHIESRLSDRQAVSSTLTRL